MRDELTAVMGAEASDLNLNVPAPAIILMAGLQGAGKTTTVGKLAKHLKEKRKKKVMVVSADVYRPAAIEQLKTLAEQVGVLFFPSSADQKPEAIVRAAIDDARKSFVDVLLVDTAGRLAIDEAMMAEIKALHAAVNPAETLFVVDAMTGGDAANTAKAFGDALPLTGVVLTKTDGDARGAALSVRYITGKPIKFVGVSEKPEGWTCSIPTVSPAASSTWATCCRWSSRSSSRSTGQGGQAGREGRQGQEVRPERHARPAGADAEHGWHRWPDGQAAGPGQHPRSSEAAGQPGKEVPRMIAIINSMTKKERRNPNLLNGSRRARIAKGSGVTPADVNKLMKQYMQMEKMMSKMAGGGMKGMLRSMKGMMGAMGGRGMPFR